MFKLYCRNRRTGHTVDITDTLLVSSGIIFKEGTEMEFLTDEEEEQELWSSLEEGVRRGTGGYGRWKHVNPTTRARRCDP